ncbi:MAG: hypothetical protein CG439_2210 [Methylococcaceae bacterium NSP1-2]|nr:MAG: hypothetical protein CG439_2210 [Methylococcaceae bacterium NSP1-2]
MTALKSSTILFNVNSECIFNVQRGIISHFNAGRTLSYVNSKITENR